ncbi:helix-turn-helix domain-containing protein [Corynebacterium bovis]|uniref:helix-turn-helix domain-containing protein n=1 Tax=Corynebacterium bovis TaxID=36808 RepID=UPI003CC753F8
MSRTTIDGFNTARFRELRLAAGLSRPQLARIAKVGVSTISAWERGTRTPTVEVLRNCMQVLGAPLSEVIPHSTKPTLRLLRISQGLSRPQVADWMELSLPGYSAIERGDTPLSELRAQQLAELYGLESHVIHHAARQARKVTDGHISPFTADTHR